MKVMRPDFRVPVLCIDDFLSNEEAEEIGQECLDLKKVFMPARVFDGANATRHDPSYRDNEVVYLDEIFRSDPSRSRVLTIIGEKVWSEDCRALWHEGYYIFDIINYCTSREAVISRYGQGHFYHRHKDTRWDHITRRLVTMIYYSSPREQKFSGGSLILWAEDDRLALEPKHNRAILFPSFVDHEVEAVELTSENWEDARFSVNYWMGFK